jgi:DNA polymerase-4
MGSDLQKPDGLVVITHANLPEVVLGLELQEICGIGKRLKERLRRAGIGTFAGLWEASPLQLRRVCGIRCCMALIFSHPPPASRKAWGTGMCSNLGCPRRVAPEASRSIY